MSRLALVLACLLTMVLLGACSTTAPRPMALSSTVVSSPAKTLESLSSSVTLSFRTTEKHISGRGVMLYQRPDQLRLVLLSPFGTTIMEALLNGQQLTLAYPSNGVAYSGLISQLPPEAGGQQPWRLLQWVLASEPPAGAPQQGTITRSLERGGDETITLEHGLVVEKQLKRGGRVRYRNYHLVHGIWLPMELLMEGMDGERITVTLEEPEVNEELGEQAFAPRLAGLRLLPLSEFKEQ